MKNNVSTEGTENVKKKKKAPLIIIAVALIAIIGACNSDKTEVDSVPDRTTICNIKRNPLRRIHLFVQKIMKKILFLHIRERGIFIN